MTAEATCDRAGCGERFEVTRGRGRPRLYCGQPGCNRARNAERQRKQRATHPTSTTPTASPAPRPSHYQVPAATLDELAGVEREIAALVNNTKPRPDLMKDSLRHARSAIARTRIESGYP